MYLLCICVLQPLSFSWFNGVRLRECPKISWNWLAGWWRLVAAITAIAQEIYMFCNDFTTVICVTYIYYIHIYFHYGDIDVISTWVFRVPIWHPKKSGTYANYISFIVLHIQFPPFSMLNEFVRVCVCTCWSERDFLITKLNVFLMGANTISFTFTWKIAPIRAPKQLNSFQ